MKAIYLAIAAAASLSCVMACAPHAATPTATTAPPAPAPPTDGGYYNSPRDILAKAAGTIPCANPSETQLKGVINQVWCMGDKTLIRLHENRSAVDDQVETMKITGSDLLTGQNWTVHSSPDILQAARQHLGGKLVHIPCQPPECQLEQRP
jgi:hypothetical protein